MRLSRRGFLKGAALFAAAAGCGARTALAGNDASTDATPACDDDHETEDNILGPYYKAGAPTRSDLTSPDMKGTRLTVRGLVTSTACKILPGVTLDVWQANADGAYDNTGYTLRGKLVTDGYGYYTLNTVVPGNYLNGSQYRPKHIHVQAYDGGVTPLTTQLYFPGDPYNGIDPWIKPSLIMPVTTNPDGSLAATFHFVLKPA